MKKPLNSSENFERCICTNCGMYMGRICEKETNMPTEKLYCARDISECKMGQGVCMCPGCEVYRENGLSSAAFCLHAIEAEEPMTDVVE